MVLLKLWNIFGLLMDTHYFPSTMVLLKLSYYDLIEIKVTDLHSTMVLLKLKALPRMG